jgi:hypothetical protein
VELLTGTGGEDEDDELEGLLEFEGLLELEGLLDSADLTVVPAL